MAIISLPLGVLISLILQYQFNITANILSLAGIAIAIGAMVDASVVMVENAHKHIEHAPPDAPREPLILEAAKEVGPSLFFALLVITVSFLPIFALERRKRPPLPAPGLHQDLCHGRGRPSWPSPWSPS